MAIEQRIKELKQKIIAVLVLSVMFVLVFTTLNLNPNYLEAATTSPTATLNVIAGTLSIDSTTAVAFASVTLGTESQITNLDINAKDYAGDGAAWAVTAFSTNFVNEGDTGTQITNARFNIVPSTGTLFNGTAQSACSQTAKGAGGTLSASRAVFNGSASATGECRLNSTGLNITVLPSDTIQTYNATMTLTIT